MNKYLVPLILALSSSVWSMSPIQGNCEIGGRVVVTGGVNSTTKVQQSFPSCQVTVYLPGTLTKVTIYNSLGVATGNPISADTTGHWVFYVPDGSYDVQISGGGLNAPYTFGSLATGCVTFVATGTGAVTRTCNSKLSDVVNVTDYGAKCDGVTDDFAAYGKAVSALGTQGGTVNLCKGKSHLSSTWVLDRSVTVIGQGNGTSCATAGSCLEFSSGVSGITTPANAAPQSKIKDFYLQSLSTVAGTDDGFVGSSNGIVLDNVTVDHFGRRLVSCDTYNTGDNGNDQHWVDVTAWHGLGDGLYLGGHDCNAIETTNVRSLENAGWGRYIDPTAASGGSLSFKNKFSGTQFQNNGLGDTYEGGVANSFFQEYFEPNSSNANAQKVVFNAANSRNDYWVVQSSLAAPTFVFPSEYNMNTHTIFRNNLANGNTGLDGYWGTLRVMGDSSLTPAQYPHLRVQNLVAGGGDWDIKTYAGGVGCIEDDLAVAQILCHTSLTNTVNIPGNVLINGSLLVAGIGGVADSAFDRITANSMGGITNNLTISPVSLYLNPSNAIWAYKPIYGLNGDGLHLYGYDTGTGPIYLNEGGGDVVMKGATSVFNITANTDPDSIQTIGGVTTKRGVYFSNSAGTHAVSLLAPATISSDVSWTLPTADASGCLQSNGSGLLSFGSCGSGSSGVSSVNSMTGALTISGSTNITATPSAGTITVATVSNVSFGTVTATGGDYLYNATAGFSAGFTPPPNSIASSLAWSLPSADAAGCWKSNGSGVLSIASCTSVGSSLVMQTAAPTLLTPYQNDTFQSGSYTYRQGNYLYATWDTGGFAIFDISNPNVAPVLRGSLNCPTTGSSGCNGISLYYAEGLYVVGRYAYVAQMGDFISGQGSFVVIDVSNPSAPANVTHITHATALNQPENLTVSGNVAYVTGYNTDAGSSMLTSIDISQPSSPVIIGTLANNGAYPCTLASYVAIQNNTAFVTCRINTGHAVGSVVAVNISNPASMTALGQITQSATAGLDYPTGIEVRGSHAFVAGTANSYIVVLDIHNPASMTLEAAVQDVTNWPGISNVHLAGNVLYTTSYGSCGPGGHSHIAAVDVTNPASPAFLGSLASPAAHGGYACFDHMDISGRLGYAQDDYLGSGGGGIYPVDLGGITTSTLNAGRILSDDIDVVKDIRIGGDLLIGGSGVAFSTSGVSFANGATTIGNLGTVSAPGFILNSTGGFYVGSSPGVTGASCSYWTYGICTSP